MSRRPRNEATLRLSACFHRIPGFLTVGVSPDYPRSQPPSNSMAASTRRLSDQSGVAL